MSYPYAHLVERLKEEMGRKGYNARKLAIAAKVGPSFVYDVLSGKSSNPTTQKLAAIADVLGINVSYLMEGLLPLEQPVNLLPDDVIHIPSLQPSSPEGLPQVPSCASTTVPLLFQKDWVTQQLHASPSTLRTFTLDSDVMFPTLHKGDVILVDITQNLPHPPGIFAVKETLGIYIRRLEPLYDNKNITYIRVTADNPLYKTYEALPDTLNILGRVLWFSRKI